LQLIKALESARGNGTSMISLILPPKDQVRVVKAGAGEGVRVARLLL
jgi:peptide chain release factor subunit 1